MSKEFNISTFSHNGTDAKTINYLRDKYEDALVHQRYVDAIGCTETTLYFTDNDGVHELVISQYDGKYEDMWEESWTAFNDTPDGTNRVFHNSLHTVVRETQQQGITVTDELAPTSEDRKHPLARIITWDNPAHLTTVFGTTDAEEILDLRAILDTDSPETDRAMLVDGEIMPDDKSYYVEVEYRHGEDFMLDRIDSTTQLAPYYDASLISNTFAPESIYEIRIRSEVLRKLGYPLR